MYLTTKQVEFPEFYLTNKFPIFPVAPYQKNPLTKDGFKSASFDPRQFAYWQQKWPTSNWGMRTGERSEGGAGILVIDIDKNQGGHETWENMLKGQRNDVKTVKVRTGSGGEHRWFLQPDGLNIRCGTGVLGEGIDVRANGGYVVIPPSITSSNYSFLFSPDEVGIASLPEWLENELVGQNKELIGLLESQRTHIDSTIGQGKRHQALLTLALTLRRNRLSTDEIHSALVNLREQSFVEGDHPISDDEILEVVSWVDNIPVGYRHSDLGNAARLIDLYGEKIHYSHEMKRWLIWDGRRWVFDRTAEIERFVQLTLQSIYIEASKGDSPELRERIAKWGTYSEARPRVEAMIRHARSLPGVPVLVEDMDNDIMLLNVRNGTIDLRTGKLIEHDRKNLITKIVDVDYDPTAECPNWLEFLDLITGGDENLQSFLQVAIGYTITGKIDEQCLFFLFGIGQNGKTTFLETIRNLLGDYAQKTSIESLMGSSKSGQGPSPYIARLAGARFVLSPETPQNRRFNETLIKDLTGGDTITARFLHANPITFTPTHKLWIYGNYKPYVTGTDLGFWRRIRVVPFKVIIPNNVKKPMSVVLQQFSEEMSGILNWAIEGCIYWQQYGLQTPSIITEATEEYRNEEDILQNFLDENALIGPEYSISKDMLFNSYKEWCDRKGERDASVLTQKWVTRQMTIRGFEQGGAQRRKIVGIKLLNK